MMTITVETARLRRNRRDLRPLVIAIGGIVLLMSRADGGRGFLARALGSNMRDVVKQIADLPETYKNLEVHSLRFSPDESQLATESDRARVNIWDWRTHSLEKTVEKPPRYITYVFEREQL